MAVDSVAVIIFLKNAWPWSVSAYLCSCYLHHPLDERQHRMFPVS